MLPHFVKKLRRELPLLEEKLSEERLHMETTIFLAIFGALEVPFIFVSIRFNACYLVPRRMRAPMPLASAFQPAPEKHAHMGFFTPFLQEPLWPGHLTERSNCSCDGPHQ